LEGVAHAHVRLTGARTAPAARIQLELQPHVDPGTALHHLTTEALTHARNSAGLASFPAEAHLKAVKHRAERVS
jgi:hypothetical protein